MPPSMAGTQDGETATRRLSEALSRWLAHCFPKSRLWCGQKGRPKPLPPVLLPDSFLAIREGSPSLPHTCPRGLRRTGSRRHLAHVAHSLPQGPAKQRVCRGSGLHAGLNANTAGQGAGGDGPGTGKPPDRDQRAAPAARGRAEGDGSAKGPWDPKPEAVTSAAERSRGLARSQDTRTGFS